MDVVDSGNKDLDELVTQWLNWDDKRSASYAVIQDLVAQKKWDDLDKAMMKRLKFGTAGIRGKMGPG